MAIYPRIFHSFGNLAISNYSLCSTHPFPILGPLGLTSQDHYLGSLPHYRFRIGPNHICCTINVYIKMSFVTKNIFVYFVYYRYLESEKAKPLSYPR
jgi:hypothetical protein